MKEVIAKLDGTGYRTILTAGNNDIIGDEPIPYGNDEGPSPYDLLLMALGSCVTMTLRMYADRKKWDLQGVEVNLTQERTHAKDCDSCESEDGYVHIIEKKVKLFGNLDDEQRVRLMEIADKCPVHKTLLNEIKISTIEV